MQVGFECDGVHFNPTIVRLRHVLFGLRLTRMDSFQSYHSAIKTKARFRAVADAFTNFNPTIVRLRLCQQNLQLVLDLIFQSYHSAIKTGTGTFDGRDLSVFQSYHSAIKTCEWF